jgi:hypothetical protein
LNGWDHWAHKRRHPGISLCLSALG